MTALLAVKIATAIAQIIILAVGIPIIIRNVRQAEKSRAADAMTLDGLAMAEGQPSTVIHTPKPDPGNL